jgi:uracil-DNA glycosylase family 4
MPATQNKSQVRELELLEKKVISCRACPRLVQWREEVAKTKRKSYQDQEYWGRPVPSFGATDPKILIVGLAPGAHGANRTGRIFTGDSSGDWLYRSLFRAGLAKLETSTARDDGQKLIDTRITCAVRCAPPGNKPTIEEREKCSHFFSKELDLLFPRLKVIIALGGFAWQATLRQLRERGENFGRIPSFGHGVELRWSSDDGNSRHLVGSYHPSQQNTFTGTLTEAMLDQVMKRAGRLAR